VPFLVLIPVMAGRGIDHGSASPWYWVLFQAVAVIGGIVVVGRFALTRLFAAAARQANEPAFICAAFLAVFAAALAGELAGLSMALGTCVLGAALSDSTCGRRLAAIVEPAKNTLLALFFLNIGARVDLEVVATSWLLLLLTVTILALKFAVMFALALLSGILVPDALRMALALSQCGEFGFVLFAAAQAGGLMPPELSALANILIAMSMLTTPFLMRLVRNRGQVVCSPDPTPRSRSLPSASSRVQRGQHVRTLEPLTTTPARRGGQAPPSCGRGHRPRPAACAQPRPGRGPRWRDAPG
jgi:Kef-type K+ transport system membrane component KefB